jgi:hypothetical protein
MVWVAALWQLASVLTDLGPTGLLAGAAAGAAVLIAAVLAVRLLFHRPASRPGPRLTSRALRERVGLTGVPRHRDPDASGRSRPRAPTAAPAAA